MGKGCFSRGGDSPCSHLSVHLSVAGNSLLSFCLLTDVSTPRSLELPPGSRGPVMLHQLSDWKIGDTSLLTEKYMFSPL